MPFTFPNIDCYDHSIIFVHEFGGHPHRTWFFKQGHAMAQGSSNTATRTPTTTDHLETIDAQHAADGASCTQPSDRKTCFWPSDLLPAECPNARIGTWGYHPSWLADPGLSNWTSRDLAGSTSMGPQSVSQSRDLSPHQLEMQLAESFLAHLEERVQAKQKLIFVAHSTGGLLLKEVRLCNNY
jgi:hypothetical protein